MPELDFREVQRRFAAHLRDPERHAPPAGIEERRLAIYRRLFINNIEDLLGRAYPVLRSLHGSERWARLTRDFYREHGCHTPYFPRLAEEFLQYLSTERTAHEDDFPFLAELAHYERAEVVVAQHEDDPDHATGITIDPLGDPFTEVPVLATATRLLAYEYPVQRIGPDFVPASPGEHPTYLVVFRDRDFRTGFIELNPLSARILWYVQNDPAPGAELVHRVAADFDLAPGEELLRSAEELLRHWLQRGVLAGTRTDSPAT
ncbi:HvfC family RiPP maturation protein [Thioalkalivibrio paradoxus]|uniref:HvfC family RiPP maturation protein n=1 Tax=Thioalkalivibrio paradoxus TaxID=108010 RepID=UPI00022C320D|nr:putative DNA-binding domain-containing protein [Thioalkalivibrio paradoxus]